MCSSDLIGHLEVEALPSGTIDDVYFLGTFDGNETAIAVYHVDVATWVLEDSASWESTNTDQPSIDTAPRTSVHAVAFAAVGSANFFAGDYTQDVNWTTGAVYNPSAGGDQGGLCSLWDIGAMTSQNVVHEPTISGSTDHAMSILVIDVG